jgi:hypothetical protein
LPCSGKTNLRRGHADRVSHSSSQSCFWNAPTRSRLQKRQVRKMRLLLIAVLCVASSAFAEDVCHYHPGEINRDEAAYQWAKREATILARTGRVYHPMGCAPGTRYSGCGSSYRYGRPNHCYLNMSPSRIVARACVRGRNGMWYWSMHAR